MSLGPQFVLRTLSNNDKQRQTTKNEMAAQEPFPCVWAGQRHPPDRIRRTGRLATIFVRHKGRRCGASSAPAAARTRSSGSLYPVNLGVMTTAVGAVAGLIGQLSVVGSSVMVT